MEIKNDNVNQIVIPRHCPVCLVFLVQDLEIQLRDYPELGDDPLYWICPHDSHWAE